MVALLVMLGLLLVIGGFFQVTEVTFGVYLAACGVFCIALARVAQAEQQYKDQENRRLEANRLPLTPEDSAES